MIILSILVPAFNYAKGVENILKALSPLPPTVELLISDDSNDTSVVNILKQYIAANIIYKKNIPPKGAVANWNNLIASANGKFLMLLHHDELPLGPNFLGRLLEVLRHTSKDVLVLDVLLLNRSLSLNRRHVPPVLRNFVIRYIPGYLFCRNVIGPTASLVVRKSSYPLFDTNLEWLVDIDLYYRLRQNTKSWEALRELSIGSVQGDHKTITESIRSHIKSLEQAEIAYLREAHPDASFWFNVKNHYPSKILEAAAWGAFRALQIALSSLRK